MDIKYAVWANTSFLHDAKYPLHLYIYFREYRFWGFLCQGEYYGIIGFWWIIWNYYTGIFVAYKKLFAGEIKSILKKTKSRNSERFEPKQWVHFLLEDCYVLQRKCEYASYPEGFYPKILKIRQQHPVDAYFYLIILDLTLTVFQ